MPVDTDVLIIGAGLSGIGFAIRLQQKYPQASFEIHEKAEQVGGTWWSNTYPGCACDVPSHLYSYSFALNPDWSEQFSPRAEIDVYCHTVAERYGIPRHITFRSTVLAATFDEVPETWTVRILDQQSGQVYERRSRILITAVGLLSEPNDCPIPGAEEYKGRLFHSARWDHSFDWAGKDVVVVGNGCSATQFVPILSDGPGSANKVTQFIRQPHWLEPRPNAHFPPAMKWVFRHVPLTMRLFRCAIFFFLESFFSTFRLTSGKKIREERMKAQTAYIRKHAPERYRDILVPKIEIGCKRRVLDTDYLACLHRENMELVHGDPIEGFTADGVRTRSGREIFAHAVILATGFKAAQPLLSIEARGVKGVSLTEHWASTPYQVPQAYYGTCVSDFPNMFILFGPNTGTGHTSVLFSVECQIEFTLKVLDPIMSGLYPPRTTLLSRLLPPFRALRSLFSSKPKPQPNLNSNSSSISSSTAPTTVSVTRQAEEAEGRWIQEASRDLVWTSGCASWYLHPSGRNTSLYPNTQVRFWWRSWGRPRWGDFVYGWTGKVSEGGAVAIGAAVEEGEEWLGEEREMNGNGVDGRKTK